MEFTPEIIEALGVAFSKNNSEKMLVVTNAKTKKQSVWLPQYKALARGEYNVQEVTREQFVEFNSQMKSEEPVEPDAGKEPEAPKVEAKSTKKTTKKDA